MESFLKRNEKFSIIISSAAYHAVVWLTRPYLGITYATLVLGSLRYFGIPSGK